MLLTVLTLALGVQASMMRMQGDYRHQFKNNKVAGAVLTQTQALELQAQRADGTSRVITTRPEGDVTLFCRTSKGVVLAHEKSLKSMQIGQFN